MGLTRVEMTGIQVDFLRHAESEENVGRESVDSPLTANGREQAAKLVGEYDHVLCSPLRRCQETLHYSSIKYEHLTISHNLRERKWSEGCYLMFEKRVPETMTDLYHRVDEFELELAALVKQLQQDGKPHKILLVGHGLFFYAWHQTDLEGRGLQNAELIHLSL